MKRRICLIGAALSVVPLAMGVTAAGAAGHKAAAVKTIKVKCKTSVSVSVASGETQLAPPESSGTEYGSASCGKLMGSGVQKDDFNIPDSGDTVARYKMYFSDGSIHGKFDLAAQEGSFGGSTFSGTNYTGTITVTGGTGAFKGAKGKGTMTCSSPDNVHTTCTDHLKLRAL